MDLSCEFESDSMENWMELKLPASAENLGLARVTVAAFASAGLDFTLEEVEEIKVAVSEAVSNAVLHAYCDKQGEVCIFAQLNENFLTVTISDNGVGIKDIDEARQASFTTLSDRMGLGFTFMESFVDELKIESDPHEGTIVTMKKRPAVEYQDSSLGES